MCVNFVTLCEKSHNDMAPSAKTCCQLRVAFLSHISLAGQCLNNAQPSHKINECKRKMTNNNVRVHFVVSLVNTMYMSIGWRERERTENDKKNALVG